MGFLFFLAFFFEFVFAVLFFALYLHPYWKDGRVVDRGGLENR